VNDVEIMNYYKSFCLRCRHRSHVWHWVYYCVHCSAVEETHCCLSLRCHTAVSCLQVMNLNQLNVWLPHKQQQQQQ